MGGAGTLTFAGTYMTGIDGSYDMNETTSFSFNVTKDNMIIQLDF